MPVYGGAGLAARPCPLLDASSTTGEAAQVVQPRAANLALAYHFDLLYAWGEAQEGALDADAVGDAAYGEVGTRAGAPLADDDAFEHLRALAVALDDLRAHANRVAGTELRHVRIGLQFNVAAQIHALSPPRTHGPAVVSRRSGPVGRLRRCSEKPHGARLR